jgi:hypothetical protein
MRQKKIVAHSHNLCGWSLKFFKMLANVRPANKANEELIRFPCFDLPRVQEAFRKNRGVFFENRDTVMLLMPPIFYNPVFQLSKKEMFRLNCHAANIISLLFFQKLRLGMQFYGISRQEIDLLNKLNKTIKELYDPSLVCKTAKDLKINEQRVQRRFEKVIIILDCLGIKPYIISTLQKKMQSFQELMKILKENGPIMFLNVAQNGSHSMLLVGAQKEYNCTHLIFRDPRPGDWFDYFKAKHPELRSKFREIGCNTWQYAGLREVEHDEVKEIGLFDLFTCSMPLGEFFSMHDMHTDPFMPSAFCLVR